MSNLPYFPAVLYFGAGSALFAFGPRGQLAECKSAVLSWLLQRSRCRLLRCSISSASTPGKWLNNIGASRHHPFSLGAAADGRGVVLAIWLATHFTARKHDSSLVAEQRGFLVRVCSLPSARVEAVSAMGDEIQNPRKTIPWAILVAGCILAIGYIGGTSRCMVALPTEAVGGPGRLC